VTQEPMKGTNTIFCMNILDVHLGAKMFSFLHFSYAFLCAFSYEKTCPSFLRGLTTSCAPWRKFTSGHFACDSIHWRHSADCLPNNFRICHKLASFMHSRVLSQQYCLLLIGHGANGCPNVPTALSKRICGSGRKKKNATGYQK
jgi:hypothetical protein